MSEHNDSRHAGLKTGGAPEAPGGMMGGRMGMGMMGGGGPGGGGRGMMPKVRAKNSKATLLRLWRYISQQRKALLLVIILTVLSACNSLIGPYIIGHAVDHYIIPRDYEGLAKACLFLIGIYLFTSFTTWVQTYIMAGVTQRTVWQLRRDMFAHLQKLSLRFFDSKTHGELMSRATNDVENVSNTMNQSVIQLITSFITLAGSLIMMLMLNVWLTLISLVTIPLVVLITGQISKFTRGYFKSQQQHLGELNGFIEETVSGQKVVKIFNREKKSIEEFQVINSNLRTIGTKAQILSGVMGPTMNLMGNLNFALVAAIGGWMAFHEYTTIGIIVSFLNYSRQFSRPINELANQYNMIQSGIAGAERVFEIMDTDTEYGSESRPVVGSAKPPVQMKGEVVFDNVSFRYTPETAILRNVSFTAKPGDTIALVGPTGAGKTTIVNLLTRFYDINEGTITIDGKQIDGMDKNSLRSNLGIVLQDAYLFSDTIRENIRYGKLDATEQELVRAAKLANADTFISKLPEGYDTLLSAEGGNLSHGQRQLITIARAILADPRILILDEATSSVDTRTEMHIQEAMNTLMKGRTSFVIAHRLSTIRDADMILVLNGGEIIERGTHDQLLGSRGFYYDLYNSQFRKVVS
jgi:ATP-binding cassette subfamily B multidrug efflux pump